MSIFDDDLQRIIISAFCFYFYNSTSLPVLIFDFLVFIFIYDVLFVHDYEQEEESR